jgi:hypothetical protein
MDNALSAGPRIPLRVSPAVWRPDWRLFIGLLAHREVDRSLRRGMAEADARGNDKRLPTRMRS